jgi:quinol monooxygenase YgiN
MSVLSVVKIRVEAGVADAILRDVAETLTSESTTQAGFLAGEIFISRDKKTVAIVTEWTDVHAWSRSRYDARVGKTLEAFLTGRPQIEFEIYDRYARVPAPDG